MKRAVIICALLCFLSEVLEADSDKGQIEISVHEAKRAAVVPCRIHLKDSARRPVFAEGLPRWRDHFVCSGTAKLNLPGGTYSYEVERGPEYLQAAGAFEIAAARECSLPIRLERIADLAAEGWWSGDLHVHRPAKDIELLMQAEDLHVAPVMTWWNNQNIWTNQAIPEKLLVKFDGNRFYHLMAGEDEREGGALLLFGLKQPLPIAGSSREYPSPMKFVAQGREHPNVWIDIEKPFWWDVPTWLASGQMNSIGLANNHMCRDQMYENEAWGKPRDVAKFPSPRGNGLWSQEIYYHILNCGSLMKLFDGTGFLIFKTRAKVITGYIRGAKRLPFSPNPGSKQWFPRLSVHFSPVLAPPKTERGNVTAARTRLTDWLHERMVQQQFETELEFGPATLGAAIEATARRAAKRVAVQDATMKKVSFRRLLTGARLLSKQWSRLSQETQRVGVLLPNVNAMPVTLLSLWAANKIPAVLNYSSGASVLLECAQLAGLKQIITSRAFIERLALDIEPFRAAGIDMLYLEEARAAISASQKALALVSQFLHLPLGRNESSPTDTAVILFTSGSEGAPKGVELTHRNVLANIRQMLSVIDLVETDRFFNALPLFHSFGLVIGLLLPLIEGVFVFLYISPLHYRVVPSAVYNLNCTVFFGTNTFLTGYGRKAHPYDFHALRYLFAGAEKLQESTVALWLHKFGVRILEGYGATECSPVITANTPMRQRTGAAGRFLPGIEHRLERVEGIGEDGEKGRGQSEVATVKNESIGRLFVRGPNVMRGYLNVEVNAAFRKLGGWYDTGDIVKIDSDGYVYIIGRLKRFAKVSGEMVSLTAIEDTLAAAFSHFGLKFAVAVVAKPDEAKGEKLIAVTNEPKLTIEQVREAIRARGLANLASPREIKVLREIPRLGSGKVNHRELEKIVQRGDA